MTKKYRISAASEAICFYSTVKLPFDCLHDEGLLFAEKLKDAGTSVTVKETKGTMHGFDSVSCAIIEEAIRQRIAFLKENLSDQYSLKN